MDATSSGSSMGATLFFGLTAAALITHTPPEVTYVSPLETMGQAPFSSVFDPVGVPARVTEVVATPGLRVAARLETEVAGISAPVLAAAPQAQTRSAGMTPIAVAAPVQPERVLPVPPTSARTRGADPSLSRAGGIWASMAAAPATEPTVIANDVAAPLRVEIGLAPDQFAYSSPLASPLSRRRTDPLPGLETVARAEGPSQPSEFAFVELRTSQPVVRTRLVATPRAEAALEGAISWLTLDGPARNKPGLQPAPIARVVWASPVPEPVLAEVTGDSVFLRRAPGVSSAPITQFDRGAEAQILEERGTWRRIQIGDVAGWMFGAYLAPIPSR